MDTQSSLVLASWSGHQVTVASLRNCVFTIESNATGHSNFLKRLTVQAQFTGPPSPNLVLTSVSSTWLFFFFTRQFGFCPQMTTGPREGCGNCGTYCQAVSGTQSRGQACGLPQGRGAYLWTPPAFKRSGRKRGHGDPQRPLGSQPVGRQRQPWGARALPSWGRGRLGVTTAVKKNKIMAFAARQMDLESVIPGEVSQKEERYSLTCGI